VADKKDVQKREKNLDISTYPQAKTEKLERKIKNVLIIF